MRDFNRIKAFDKADELVIRVYEITKDWPKDEQYGLTSQLRRAAVSVAANIVEGSGREHKAEYLHFLSVARASLRETGYYLHLASRLGYLTAEAYADINGVHDQASRVLWGLISCVSGQVRADKTSGGKRINQEAGCASKAL